jgi:hypothetical protein
MSHQSSVGPASNRTEPLATERTIMGAAIDAAEELLKERDHEPRAEAVAVVAAALIALRRERLHG